MNNFLGFVTFILLQSSIYFERTLISLNFTSTTLSLFHLRIVSVFDRNNSVHVSASLADLVIEGVPKNRLWGIVSIKFYVLLS